MKDLKVVNMHCGNCVARITKALEAEGIACAVSLETKTVSVEAEKVERAIDALDDLGFSAEIA